MLQTYQTQNYNSNDSLSVSETLMDLFRRRRSIRHFSDQKVDPQVVLNCIQVAGLAPSGANKQPWSFCLIENDNLKAEIRNLAEKEEQDFYLRRKPSKWLNDLKHLHTDENKSCLTEAQFLIPVFSRGYEKGEDQETNPNYYAKESVGIATGFLISALHLSGLSTLTYTPSRMNFLPTHLERPKNEKLFMVLLAGLPATEAQVPVISKKALDQIVKTYL